MLPSGNDLLKVLEAIANPYRLKIIALLHGRSIHVSQLAREVMISRPLLYMHLKKLESAGLVTSIMELSDNGKAMRFYELTSFSLQISPESIAEAVKTLTLKKTVPTVLDPDTKKEKEDDK
ncbi:winged helix-turn-helix transcriptional regulator [Heliorestis acidaminivorans]|uniref:Winged helix-turn-helix transcriptional regulator n=2 Tax=Heliorestis acidaminivorans TaxID=553427 RepID=A0A6I0F205_9FIRM|nr:winged helix-turn-helix transcriptional regulator [Heliorestis acidaminivorans]